MIVELGVGLLAVGAAGYALYWQRRRAKMPRWAKAREERARRLKRLGNRIDSLWDEIHREEKRSGRPKKGPWASCILF